MEMNMQTPVIVQLRAKRPDEPFFRHLGEARLQGDFWHVERFDGSSLSNKPASTTVPQLINAVLASCWSERIEPPAVED